MHKNKNLNLYKDIFKQFVFITNNCKNPIFLNKLQKHIDCIKTRDNFPLKSNLKFECRTDFSEILGLLLL